MAESQTSEILQRLQGLVQRQYALNAGTSLEQLVEHLQAAAEAPTG